MLLATIPAAGSLTFNTTFIPQFIVVRGVAGADLTGDITGQINVQGDGLIFNLDAAGFDAMSNIHQYLVAASRNTIGRVFQLATSLVTGKNTFWTFTNGDAADVQIFGYSKVKAMKSAYYTYLTQLVLANSGADFGDFAYMTIPALAAGDNLSVLYNDGLMDANRTLRELAADNAYYQTPDQFAIDNVAPARVKMVTITPVANRNIYLLRYQPVTGNVDAALIAKA